MTRERPRQLRTWPLALTTLAILAPVATFLVTAWVMGWTLQSVRTGSMAPTFPEGSLLVVEPFDASDVEPGMVVMFADPAQPARLVTHRVVRRAPGKEVAFVTRGDANATDDPLSVPARAIRGRVKWQVRQAGSAMGWIEWPRNAVVLVVIPGLVLAVTEVRAKRRRSSVGVGPQAREPVRA